MRATAVAAAVCCIAAILPASASAEPPAAAPGGVAAEESPPPGPLPLMKRSRSHRHQLGLDVTVGSGYRIAFKYSGSYACGPDPGKTNCYDRIPTWLDVKLFFGVSRSVDLLVEQRFGLEKDFYGAAPLMIMPGLRWYADPDAIVKLFIQVQAAFEFSDPGAHELSRYDIGLHEVNGLQVDVLPWLGAYVQVSPTILFLRSLDFQIEAGGGLEVRLP